MYPVTMTDPHSGIEMQANDDRGLEFMALMIKAGNEAKDQETKDIQFYCDNYNIAAMHPDDGWVDREKNYVILTYPCFKRDVEIGDFIALGSSGSYRLVTVTGIRKFMTITYYDFDKFNYEVFRK